MSNYYRKPRAKQRSVTTHPGNSSIWLWVFTGMFVGILGTVIAYMALNPKGSLNKPKPITAFTSSVSKTSRCTSNPKKDPAQRFEFYTLLPGMEVPLPDPQDRAPASSEAKPQPKEHTIKSAAVKPNSNSVTVRRTIAIAKPHPANTMRPTVIAVKPHRMNPLRPAVVRAKPMHKPTVLTQKHTPFRHSRYLIQVGIFRQLQQADALKKQLTLQGFSPYIQKISVREGGAWFRVAVGPYPTESLALKEKNRLKTRRVQGILVLQQQ